MTTQSSSGTFTGRHMLLIMLAFFAVIITVNLTMATIAGSSWTGFVVRNSYIASQEFNGKVAEARKQMELGWRSHLALDEGTAFLRLYDKQAQELDLATAELVLRSPATDAEDLRVTLEARDSSFAAPVTIRNGQWVVEVRARTLDGTEWHETRRVVVRDGAIR